MRIKLYIFIAIILVFASSCGKKLPPPSPDIFPAKIISGYYIPNSQIRIDFNENIDNTFDSAFYGETDLFYSEQSGFEWKNI